MAEDAALTLGRGLATANGAPLILALCIVEFAWPSGVYSMPDALRVAPIALAMWMMGLWLVVNRGKQDDHVALAVKDPQSLAVSGLLAVGFTAAVLLPSGSARMLNFSELFHLSAHSRGQ